MAKRRNPQDAFPIVDADGETTLLVNPAPDHPTRLVQALRTLFARLPQVDAAYLAQCRVAGSDEEPHHVVGIEGSGDVSAAIREAGRVARRHLERGELVDFIRIGDSALSRYMVECIGPFYRRASPPERPRTH